MRRVSVLPLAAMTMVLATAPLHAQAKRALPYWASLSAGDALLRTGPGRDYPATWRYRRIGLPLKVIAVRESWRRVRELDGTEGWMASVLLTEQRTGMVTGVLRELRAAPDAGAAVVWRVQPGVIGTLAHCAGGWCELDIKGRKGFLPADELWGVDAGETVN